MKMHQHSAGIIEKKKASFLKLQLHFAQDIMATCLYIKILSFCYTLDTSKASYRIIATFSSDLNRTKSTISDEMLSAFNLFLAATYFIFCPS